MPPGTDLRRLAALLAALLSAFILFAFWPGLDLTASRAFFDPAAGRFPIAGDPLVEALRKAVWGASVAMLVAALALLVAALLRGGRAAGLPARAWAHIVALYALGPGLLVETLLKGHWGRARPSDIAEFGGAAAYSLPAVPAAECAKNCSFVAGEPAGAMALCLSLALVLAWQGRALPRGLRAGLTFLAAAAPLLASAQRLASGRHFLSDIAFAILLILLVEAVLALLTRPWPPGPARPVDKPRDSS